MTYKPLTPRSQAFPLKWPFEYAGTSYSELTLRRPMASDLDAVIGAGDAAAQTKKSRAMLANLAQVEPAVIGCLDPEDMAAIQAWLEPILDPKGPPSPTGGA